MSEENTTLPGGLNEKQIRLLWVYLPVFVMLAQGFVIWKLAQMVVTSNERLNELQERRLTEKNDIIKQKDEIVKQWQDGYFRLYDINRNGKNNYTSDSL